MRPRRPVTFVIHGVEHAIELPGEMSLGDAKVFVLQSTGTTRPGAPCVGVTPGACVEMVWAVRDPGGFLLNESTLIADMIDRDGVRCVHLTLPVGAGGS